MYQNWRNFAKAIGHNAPSELAVMPELGAGGQLTLFQPGAADSAQPLLLATQKNFTFRHPCGICDQILQNRPKFTRTYLTLSWVSHCALVFLKETCRSDLNGNITEKSFLILNSMNSKPRTAPRSWMRCTTYNSYINFTNELIILNSLVNFNLYTTVIFQSIRNKL